MTYLFKLEWLKWKNHRVFLLFLLFYSILLPGALMAGKGLPDLPDPIGSNDVLFMFPTVWTFLSYIGNWLAFFLLGFLGVVIVTTEYRNKTLRQSVMSGVSRKDFLWAKLLFAAGISLAATLYMILCGLVIGFLNTDVVIASKLWAHVGMFPRYWLMCFGYMTFGMMVGFLIKRTGLALLIYLGYITMIEPILRWALHHRYFPNESMHFYPLNSIEELVQPPYGEILEQFTKKEGFSFNLTFTQAVITASIYILIFIFFMKKKVERSDL